MPRAESGRLDRSLVHMLHRAGQHANDAFMEIVGSSFGLTPRQLAILDAVNEQDGASQTEIVRRTGIDRSTLSQIIPRLMRKGLLMRQRSRNDSRIFEIRLSPNGRDALVASAAAAAEVDERLLANLSPDARRNLLQVLAELARHGGSENRRSGVGRISSSTGYPPKTVEY